MARKPTLLDLHNEMMLVTRIVKVNEIVYRIISYTSCNPPPNYGDLRSTMEGAQLALEASSPKYCNVGSCKMDQLCLSVG